jgi:hypothetical protein
MADALFDGDSMVRTIRPAGVAAGIAVCLLLIVSGCQKDRAATPAAKVEPPADAAVVVQPPADVPDADSAKPATREEPKAHAAQPESEPNEVGPAVSLVLGFSPGQTATYKVTTEAHKSVEWIGPESGKPAGYADGRSGNYVEITFAQQVQRVRDDGNAVLEITVKDLKYRGLIQSRTVLEFDSERLQDRDNPLAAVVGKSYRLEMSPKGKVVELLDMDAVRRAVKAGTPEYSVAVKLFSDEIVRDRHDIPPLSVLQDGQARPGQSWSDLKSFGFGEMGLKGFERVYTLKRAESDDGRVALVEMKAIPSAAMAEELHKRQSAGPMSGLFDSTDKYEGRLELDLDGGRIREYMEEMQAEWVIADPAAMQDTTAEPRGLKMGAGRLHRLELVK